MGVVVCFGCREQLDLCACAELDEAKQAALLIDCVERRCYMCGRRDDKIDIQGVYTGGPICVECIDKPRRCYVCDEMKRLNFSTKPTEMCFDCAHEEHHQS